MTELDERPAGNAPATPTMEDLRGKTPEELYELVNVTDAHIGSLHKDDRGALRTLDDAEKGALKMLIDVRAAAMKMLEDHRSIQEVLQRRPQSVERALNSIGYRDDDPYSDVRRLGTGEARDKALRRLDNKNLSGNLDADQMAHVERQIRTDPDIARRILVTENESYRNAWKKLVTNPNASAFLTEDERHAVLAYEEYRALSEGVTTAGGFGIPVKLAA